MHSLETKDCTVAEEANIFLMLGVFNTGGQQRDIFVFLLVCWMWEHITCISEIYPWARADTSCPYFFQHLLAVQAVAQPRQLFIEVGIQGR